jgi:hypothetical protein
VVTHIAAASCFSLSPRRRRANVSRRGLNIAVQLDASYRRIEIRAKIIRCRSVDSAINRRQDNPLRPINNLAAIHLMRRCRGGTEAMPEKSAGSSLRSAAFSHDGDQGPAMVPFGATDCARRKVETLPTRPGLQSRPLKG